MNTSLKIGAISGLVAGIIAGIVASISNTAANMIDLPNPIITVPETNIPEIYVMINVIYGMIFGIIFSLTHNFIPGKHISKGFFYGIIIFFLTNFRDGTFLMPYGGMFVPIILSWLFIGFFKSIAYGLVLVIIYEIISSKYDISEIRPKIETYDVMRGLHVGGIAGFISGTFAFLARVLGGIIGLFPVYYFAIEGGKIILKDVPYLYLAGLHILLNLCWGIVFGMMYTKVYNLVPAAGINKGFLYGMILFLVTSFHSSLYWFLFGDLEYGWAWAFIGFIQFAIYGLILGYVYKKE